MSRIGRRTLYGVVVLARISGRYERYWPLFAVWRGCSGVMSPIGCYLPYGVVGLACVGGRYEPRWLLFPV